LGPGRFEETHVLQWIESGGGLTASGSEDCFRDKDEETANIKSRLSGGQCEGNAGDLNKEE